MSVFKGTSRDLEFWLSSINFELFVTAHFPNHKLPTQEVNQVLIDDCLRPIATGMKTVIAAVTVIVPATRNKPLHTHSGVISKGNLLHNHIDELRFLLAVNQNDTLSADNAINVQRWRPIAHYPDKSHPEYFVDNVNQSPDYSIVVYNQRLLTKVQI